ncbi:hypothetical protein LBMAG27_07600 [Bacteroidota bacterium]|nr:hypothetical protein LBMAG27_07600 [Bacteroidota bacterium]
MMKKFSSAITILLLLISGCYYDKYDKLYPPATNANCDSVNVTYAVTVRAILDNYCMSCHDATTASGGAVFDSHSNILPWAQSGQLMGDVKQLSGFVQMPPGSKLSDCDIAKLQKWVNDGAPDN